jgi:hypothetical protein
MDGAILIFAKWIQSTFRYSVSSFEDPIPDIWFIGLDNPIFRNN